MKKEDILRLANQVIDVRTLDEIGASEDVKVIRDNGTSGDHPGKRWYVVVFNNGRGVSVYCKNKDLRY